jgi:acyl carrier protein
MDTSDVMERAREVIASTFGLPTMDVPDSASPATVPKWDSLHHLTLIVALEDQFNVTYTSHEIPQMNSLDAIMRVTARHLRLDVAS